MSAIEFLKGFNLIDCEYFVNKWLENKPMLAEGAQGSMLDIDYGSYPFVTSSSTTVGGVCTGLGVAPSKIGHVYGIFKAYCTRVGSGPFPTELFDETGEKIRQVGHEFGAVTGRPRRCGWLDLVALKYTVMIDGVTDLIMMKSDCLDDFETIKVCTSYKVDGVETDQVPFDIAAQIEPVYTEFPGWKKDLTGIRKESELPQEFKNYIKFMESYLGVPISIISTRTRPPGHHRALRSRLCIAAPPKVNFNFRGYVVYAQWAAAEVSRAQNRPSCSREVAAEVSRAQIPAFSLTGGCCRGLSCAEPAFLLTGS